MASSAWKNSLRAQHLNNALTECLKWVGVNLLCHGRARWLGWLALPSFVTVARARAFPYLSGPALFLYCSTGPRHLDSFPTRRSSDLALSYGVSFATTRSHQLARGAPACFL